MTTETPAVPATQPIPGPQDAGVFATDEILWFNNGRWGAAGYAIPNPAGKVTTSNSVCHGLVFFIGRELFDLMHRPDVRFTRPPCKQFLYDVHKMVVLARKRIADRAVDFNQQRFDAQHATPNQQEFNVYPIPYFGERIRQIDVREWCQLTLLCLGEIMQHSDNDFTLDVTTLLAAQVSRYMQRILVLMATKYFGFTTAAASAPDFMIPDDAFKNYNPASLTTASEMTEERQPRQWHPTENDLSPLRALPISAALHFANRWPSPGHSYSGSGNPGAFPGAGQPTADTPRFVGDPLAAP